jgi:fumarate reductase flavoprotein subunit
MPVLPAKGQAFDIEVPVLIIGGGASGLVAALAAKDAGVDPVVLERDVVPSGSTALSSGMIPACGTRVQQDMGVEDSVAIMSADIMKKSRNQADPTIVDAMCRASGPTIDWLIEKHGLELTLVEGFLYPCHSHLRMHAPVSRSGADLMAGLIKAAEGAGIDIMTGAHVTDIFADEDNAVKGVRITRPDQSTEVIGCKALILACNGFGGNATMVQQLIPDMADALYFGHMGNQGDAILWGQALGAGTKHLASYQGHGSVCDPHGILMSWALMMEGGIQLNANGKRFSNEHDGYSEQAQRVLQQPGAIAWNIFDDRLRGLVTDFEDFRQAEHFGAVLKAQNLRELAEIIEVDEAVVAETFSEITRFAAGEQQDPYGRDFSKNPALKAPFYAVKVTGALFHTQGGLLVDAHARVLDENSQPLPNLFASGGAACGVSGSEDWGYLSGNGLLSAVSLGKIAGASAARS